MLSSPFFTQGVLTRHSSAKRLLACTISAVMFVSTPGTATAAPSAQPLSNVTGSAADVMADATGINVSQSRRLSATPTPKISGTVTVGQTLTAKPGTWKPGSVKLSYQWKRDGKAIKGATKSTYKLTGSDRGKKIIVTVTGKRSGYRSVSKSSAATRAVHGVFAKPTVKLSGTARIGATLSVTASANPSATMKTYQWYRDGKVIPGATKSTYAVTSADQGKALTVRVTGKANGYTTTTKNSKATANVKASGWYRSEFGAFAPVTYSGSGDDVITLPDGFRGGIVTATHRGASNLIVTSHDEEGWLTDLLVNEIGDYSGTTLLAQLSSWDEPSTDILVQAAGDWTLTVAPVSSAPQLQGSGVGDGVFRYDGGRGDFTLSHAGQSNFIVAQVYESGHGLDWNLLVNDIGSYTGTVSMISGPSVIVVLADCAWTAKRQ